MWLGCGMCGLAHTALVWSVNLPQACGGLLNVQIKPKTQLKFNYKSLLSLITPCSPSLLQITQLKIEFNPFAKGFRGADVVGYRK